MDKHSKKVIKEAVESLYTIHNFVCEENEKYTSSGEYKNKSRLEQFYEEEKFKGKFDIIRVNVVKLNELLDKQEQIKEVVDLAEEMKKIQVKKNITVKEFSEIYNISKTSQQNYRGRLHDPLPYHQKVEGGKIVYVVDEVEKWFQNQHK